MKKNRLEVVENPEENVFESVLDEVVRKGAQKMLETALNLEVEEFCRSHAERQDKEGRRQVVRNGLSEARTIVTGAGPLKVRTPRVDDRILKAAGESRFKSSLVPPYLRRSKNIEELVPVLYLKGISTGDFTQALEKILGKDVVGFSAENIVRMKQIWQQDYEKWMSRDLSKSRYVYWWVDGIYFNVRLDDDRQCILVIIGAKADGTKELIAVVDGFRESKESWASIIRELKRRGLLEGPELAIGDGALGFWAAIAEEFPKTKTQICWVHKTVNVLDKMPSSLQGKAKKMIHDIYLAPAKMDANVAFDVFIEEFDLKYPKAVDSLRLHRQELLSFYDFPAEQWQHIRSTNVIESTFSTVRLRTKKTKGCGSRIATLTMVFKLAESAEKRWKKLRGYRKISQLLEGVQFQDGIALQKAA
ncbi:MAG: IS256 family transposase [Candidatus Omnitrophica bacterium]|nr:IS256 family transposase [Candidatus Omnitrophota bacterium]